MVKISTLQKAVLNGKIKQIIVKKAPSEENMIVEKVTYDKKSKWFHFYDSEGNLLFKFHKFNIAMILNISDDDNEYVFNIELKNCDLYEMRFIMESDYSFFAADEAAKENVSSVIKAAPKYLCDLRGRRVKVTRSAYHQAFSKYDDFHDIETSVTAGSFLINDFDYIVKNMSGLAVIDFVDNSDKNTFATAIDVAYICNSVGNTGTIVLGTHCGGYVLKIVD